MINPKFNKPEIIANEQFQIQIVDTLKTVKIIASISFAGFTYQFNRTLVKKHIKKEIEKDNFYMSDKAHIKSIFKHEIEEI